MIDYIHQIPDWAVYLLITMVAAFATMAINQFINRIGRIESRVLVLEEENKHLTDKVSEKADSADLQLELHRLSDRNHNDLKEIHSQISKNLESLHFRLDALHTVIASFAANFIKRENSEDEDV